MKASYAKLTERLQKLDGSIFTVSAIGQISSYPIFCISNETKPGKKTILISAGIHGDEPAGPEAVLDLLETGELAKHADRFNFFIIPCINPSGYELGTRENSAGVDINRSFDSDSVKESKIMRRFLDERRFDLFLEFHEDWEYDGYYLYELARPEARLGGKIIAEMAKSYPILNGIADERPVRDGIVDTEGEIPPGIGEKIMPLYIARHNSDHVITSETPSKFDMESRVNMHKIVLSVALRSPL